MDCVLVVEDDRIGLKSLCAILRKEPYKVETATSGEEALRLLNTRPFDLVLTDLVMEAIDGLSVLARAKERDPEIQVIVMTGFASVPTAIEAMKKGAFHYLQKPFRPDEVRHLIELALEKRRLKTRVADLQRQIEGGPPSRILGNSPKIAHIRRLVRQVAENDANVMVTGESGTGKELVASAIHQLSRRSTRKFLPINCASFTEELLANELFGHEKDAFTGATTTRSGLLEVANGGTIFFDEVGDMPLVMQAKLLRVVQERELIRVGGSRPIKIDVRIISATNKDLKLAMRHGNFREDLYYRLNVVPIAMPTLAERKQDIPLLIKHFLDRFNRRSQNRILGFSHKALELLCSYNYPGNVRELENIVERAAALSRSEIIDVETLPDDLKELEVYSMPQGASSLKTLEEVERNHIEAVLARCGHNKSKAAEILGINRVSLYRKLKRTQIRE
jgi:DNA-binding NtrC family response regulator